MHKEKIQLTLKFKDGTEKHIDKGISLAELTDEFQNSFKHRILAARVDNDIKELTFVPEKNCTIEFLDITNEDGYRIYKRSLYFLLIKSVNDLFKNSDVKIQHSISKGIYFEIEGDRELSVREIKSIENRMKELVNKKIPFTKITLNIDEARKALEEKGRKDRVEAIEYRIKPYVTVYDCDGFEDYFYGYMVPDTSYLPLFKLKKYSNGVILMYPNVNRPDSVPQFSEQKTLFSIFKEYKNWNKILGVENIGALNDYVKKGNIGELIWIAEALHEKKIAYIADKIYNSKQRKRIILISGPSSSGKTTFAKRLSIQLRVNGIKPRMISLDDYFLDREQTPIDENGDFNFEALEAIDVPLFNEQLLKLLKGKEVEIPRYSFQTGSREPKGRMLKLEKEDVLVIEGIHGLNDKLTSKIPNDKKFRIYISALTSMNIDTHNRIPSTDTRMIRRMVRDNRTRNTKAIETIQRWTSVRRGEEKNIFPFQDNADVMFNSSLIYELGVLKTYAEPLLKEIDNTHYEYSEAKRLIEFLSYFVPIDRQDINSNSILREFIGGNCFYGC
jgi:uridine kinase